jgi:hypothetical protein
MRVVENWPPFAAWLLSQQGLKNIHEIGRAPKEDKRLGAILWI